jgi:hypothetical protein
VIDAGVEEDALGGRGLAGIDVGHDAEVPVALDGCGTCHFRLEIQKMFAIVKSPPWMAGFSLPSWTTA